MPTVTIDASDAHGAALRGWGRYVFELLGALRRGAAAEFAIDEAVGWRHMPEVVWEQVGLARRARELVHSPNCFLPLRRRCPGVVTIHDLAFEDHGADFGARTRLKYRALAPRAARSAERVICPSQFTADDVSRRYGVPAERIRVIAMAPSLSVGSVPPPEGPYLLGVGDLRSKKDFATLVRAWRALRAEGLPHRLVLAGSDEGEGERLRALAGGEPLELAGYLGEAQLDALMRGAATLVHPSLYEGFGLVLVEAMARGTPVIAARTSALPETGGNAARYFEPGDADQLAEAIRRILDDPHELIERGLHRAAGLSWDATARATVDVYRELVG